KLRTGRARPAKRIDAVWICIGVCVGLAGAARYSASVEELRVGPAAAVDAFDRDRGSLLERVLLDGHGIAARRWVRVRSAQMNLSRVRIVVDGDDVIGALALIDDSRIERGLSSGDAAKTEQERENESRAAKGHGRVAKQSAHQSRHDAMIRISPDALDCCRW